jgi:hypothetical protein
LVESVSRVDEFRARRPGHAILDLHYADLVVESVFLSALARPLADIRGLAGNPNRTCRE